MTDNGQLKAVVNGCEREVTPGTSLAALVRAMGVDPARVVVERNRAIVPGGGLESTMVEDGDSIEVIHFVGGG